MKTNDVEAERRILSILNPSTLCYIPITSKIFSDRSTGVKFSTTSGAMTEYSFSATSSAEKAASALAETTKNVASEAENLKYAGINAEITDLEKKTKLLDAEASYEKAKVNLYNAQKAAMKIPSLE
jgi:hypothetical protein